MDAQQSGERATTSVKRSTRKAGRLRRILAIVREPVLAESRRHLAEKWNQLPKHLRTERQMYGRQGGGCGATIGVMPRCDFACRGCYLGAEANHVPPAELDEVKRQIDRLRERLGDGGDLQLTDGAITLRPCEDLIALIRYARVRGLIPMLMTHGDTFRRRPGLLERLMVEGGLSEVSIHVDTTQRGRLGAAYKHATREEELTPLREEFAALVRDARRTTGRRLRCAMTMTVTRTNLRDVPVVARWAKHNADVIHVLSFQPIAQVGRTDPSTAEPIDVDEVWRAIGEGLIDDGDPDAVRRRAELLAAHVHFGHPACNRVVPGIAVRSGLSARYVPIWRAHAEEERRVVEAFFSRFGGITFRRDDAVERLVRLSAIVARAPMLFARGIATYGLSLARRVSWPNGVPRLAWDVLHRQRRIDSLLLVSHHFMSSAELQTSLGRERLENCVFRVPIRSDLVSMCEVNAAGGRDQVYTTLSRASATRKSADHQPRPGPWQDYP